MSLIQLTHLFKVLVCLPVLVWSAPGRADSVTELLKKELSRTYSGAKIDLGAIQWVRGSAASGNGSTAAAQPSLASYQSAVLYGDDGRGNAHFLLQAETTTAEVWVAFSAWLPAKVALKRVHPGERLSEEAFVVQQIDVATGVGREYRGVIFPSAEDVASYESTQTLLEGRFLLSSAMRKVPDIRRGDSLRIQLVSGDLTLSTQGIAQETGYLNGTVRALTTRNKREVSGLLKADGVLEVKL